MIKVISNWYERNLTDPEAVILLFILVTGLFTIMTIGDFLAPVLASVVVAYVLDWLVEVLAACKVPRALAVVVAFVAFLSVLALVILLLLPMLWQQLLNLLNDLPVYAAEWQNSLKLLPQQYPEMITSGQVEQLSNSLKNTVAQMGQFAVSTTVSSIPTLIEMFIYLIIVPLMVFFFLYDRNQVLHWCLQWVPENRKLLAVVWRDVNQQLGNYIRGKVVEIVIVGLVTYTVFFFLDLNYAVLLSVAVGLSVLLPYVGAAVVTLPIATVAIFQFGWSAELLYVMVAYGVIQALDGNVLVPLLFYEAVSIHPIATITAILVFGGFWGFWGIFFAIPLAILCRSVMQAWPRRDLV